MLRHHKHKTKPTVTTGNSDHEKTNSKTCITHMLACMDTYTLTDREGTGQEGNEQNHGLAAVFHSVSVPVC